MTDYDIVIIGAGAVGLAIAATLSEKGKNILVIERHPSFGNEISSRNSEVIHSGIYYERDSLKAKLCVEGNKLIYEWCSKYEIPHKKTGKFIISIDENEDRELDRLFRKGYENGVEGLRIVDSKDVKKVNPGITCKSALWSPNSGIVDSHKLMESFLFVAKTKNCDFLFNHKVVRINRINDYYSADLCSTDGEYYSVTSNYIINAAGLDSDLIASSAGIDIDKKNYRHSFVKGHYFRIRAGLSQIANTLIYPVPPVNFTGLGVHITCDLGGGLKLGPDVKYLENRDIDYSVPDKLLDKFYSAAVRFIPELKQTDLSPDQSGIRPKLQKVGEPTRDFIISEEKDHNLPGLINLIGIESPGLTSCLAIANYIKENWFTN